jgi:hypothetical protein
MSSGVVFNETGSMTEEDWVKCFFESTLKFEPGKNFSYNSINSYMLSAIVRQISGQSLTEYLRERLFDPLGIKNIHWETCPRGIEKGGWGLYILPEDVAKIGMLYLLGGVWKGKRIISAEWLKASTQNIMKTSAELGGFDYGYHIWVGKSQPSFLFNGMFGQNVLGFFDTGILLVSNAGNDELFQQGAYYSIAEKYFGRGFSPADKLPKNYSAERRLRILEKSLGKTPPSFLAKFLCLFRPLPKQCVQLIGKSFIIDGKIKSVGLFPLIAQVLQNNFTQGIKSFAFSVKNETFMLLIDENDCSYEIPIGFSEAKYSNVNIHGEPYILAAEGSFSENEDGNLVLLLKLYFIEIANSRSVKFTFDGDNIRIDFSDRPGLTQIKLYISSLGTVGKMIDLIFSKIDPDFLDFKLKNIFEPVMFASLDKSEKLD